MTIKREPVSSVGVKPVKEHTDFRNSRVTFLLESVRLPLDGAKVKCTLQQLSLEAVYKCLIVTTRDARGIEELGQSEETLDCEQSRCPTFPAPIVAAVD